MPIYKSEQTRKYRVNKAQPNDNKVILSDSNAVPPTDEAGERRRSRIVTPRPKSSETNISMLPKPHDKPVSVHHEPTPKGSFAELQRRGLRITNYREEYPT